MKDLVVIGGGPGGYIAAIRARQLGLDVTLIEKDAVGGTCLNRGCIPTKAYFKNAGVIKTITESQEYGVEVSQLNFDMATAKARKDKVVSSLVSGIKQLLLANGVEIIKGEASLVDKSTILVDGQELKTEKILLATGSVPSLLPIKGIELEGVMTSDDILELSEVPKRLVIIGGGVIGLEFACIFKAFGSEVTVIEYQPSVLNILDKEVGKRMGVFLKKQKITVHTSAAVQSIEKTNDGLEVQVEGKKGELVCTGDMVLVAGGRKPYIAGLNLEKVGIETDKRGFITVDDNYQTNVEGIYAIGDVIGGQMLTHVASEEGIAAVEKIAGSNGGKLHYNAVPSCIFTFPEIATVGMTEEALKESGINYKTGKFLFAANGKAMTMGETDGFVKIIADENDQIIGVHIIGPHASDLILEGTMLVKNQMKTSQVIGTIHPHPTLGEAMMEAILDVNQQAIHVAPRKK